MLTCLQNSVGLTRSQNPCIISGLTPEQIARLQASKSGLYLDEIEGGLSWQAIKSIDIVKNYYQQVTQAQDNAIMELERDLVTQMSLRYTSGKKRFAGTIGQKSMTQSLQLTQRWQGLRFRPKDNSDAVLTINKIQSAFNATGMIDYYLVIVPYNGNMGEVVKTWTGNEVQANTWSNVADFVPTMQLFTGNNIVYDIYLVYNLTATMASAQPKNNELTCNCSGSEAQKPGQFADVQGVYFDGVLNDNQLTISNLQADNFAHGLVVDISINCESYNFFCQQYESNEAVGVTMNWMLLYKMQQLLIKSVLNSVETSRYTTMDKDLMLMNLGFFKNQYEKRLPYLINDGVNINDAGSCYTCKPATNQPIKKTVFL